MYLLDSFLCSIECRMGHFGLCISFLSSNLVAAPSPGRCLHHCLNFWREGIGLSLWEVGGLGLTFSCFPPICSLSDHFLLLSVHKYKKYICINF